MYLKCYSCLTYKQFFVICILYFSVVANNMLLAYCDMTMCVSRMICFINSRYITYFFSRLWNLEIDRIPVMNNGLAVVSVHYLASNLGKGICV